MDLESFTLVRRHCQCLLFHRHASNELSVQLNFRKGKGLFQRCPSYLVQLLRPLIILAQNGELGGLEESIDIIDGLIDRFDKISLKFEISEEDRRLINAIAERVYVFCMSEQPSSLLMWSHYADHHKGVVMGFDIKSPYAEYLANTTQISYRSEIPNLEEPIELARKYLGLQVQTKQSIYHRNLYLKSKEWEYEKEWRVVANVEMRKHNRKYIPFDTRTVSSIIVGCRCNEMEIRGVIDLVLKLKLPSDILLSVKNSYNFTLDFIPISNGKARQNISMNITNQERASWYRRCLDSFIEKWNQALNDPVGMINRVRCEGFLADHGPSKALRYYRDMIDEIDKTLTLKPRPAASPEDNPEELRLQRLRILKPSAQMHGLLEKCLSDDLNERGINLPISVIQPDHLRESQ